MIQISLFHQSEILPSQQVKRAFQWTKTFGPQFSVQTLSIYVRSIFYRNNVSELLVQFLVQNFRSKFGSETNVKQKNVFLENLFMGLSLRVTWVILFVLDGQIS